MKKCYSGQQIVSKLRQADILIDQGKTINEVLACPLFMYQLL